MVSSIVTNGYGNSGRWYNSFWYITIHLVPTFSINRERLISVKMWADIQSLARHGRFGETGTISFISFSRYLDSNLERLSCIFEIFTFVGCNRSSLTLESEYECKDFIFQRRCIVASISSLVHASAKLDLSVRLVAQARIGWDAPRRAITILGFPLKKLGILRQAWAFDKFFEVAFLYELGERMQCWNRVNSVNGCHRRSQIFDMSSFMKHLMLLTFWSCID